MRKRHVTRAELVDHPEDAQVAADPVPGLDADQARDLALGHRLLDTFNLQKYLGSLDPFCEDVTQTIGVCHKREIIRVHFDEPLDDVDLLDALLHGILVLSIAAEVSGPELESTKSIQVLINDVNT